MSSIKPLLSIIIPVLNEEQNLQRLFTSLAKQTYPRERIEYLLMDDGSTDGSNGLARKFGAEIIDIDRSKHQHPVSYWTEFNKGLGLRMARGEFVYFMDADMEICVDNFFQLMIEPMLKDQEIVGSFTKEFALDCLPKIDNSLLRFISHDPLQRDPIYRFFSNDIANTVVAEFDNYQLCWFEPGKIPPCGRIMYKKKELLKTEVDKIAGFYDLDALEVVVAAGWHNFAYVPKAKLRHYHVTSLRNLIKKRLRNLDGNYFSTTDKKYAWFDINSPKDLDKIIYWIVYANLFFPELVRGLWESFVKSDWAFMWRPVVSLVITDVLLWGFISRSKGREIIKKVLGLSQ
ncbi:MAG: glycosyltransferase family 2 protein [Patescibacteria group bacterium]